MEQSFPGVAHGADVVGMSCPLELGHSQHDARHISAPNARDEASQGRGCIPPDCVRSEPTTYKHDRSPWEIGLLDAVLVRGQRARLDVGVSLGCCSSGHCS